MPYKQLWDAFMLGVSDLVMDFFLKDLQKGYYGVFPVREIYYFSLGEGGKPSNKHIQTKTNQPLRALPLVIAPISIRIEVYWNSYVVEGNISQPMWGFFYFLFSS